MDNKSDWRTKKQSPLVKKLMKLRQVNEKLSHSILGLASMIHLQEVAKLDILEMCNFVEEKDEEIASQLDDILQEVWQKYELYEVQETPEN
jgi:hypothetical protein